MRTAPERAAPTCCGTIPDTCRCGAPDNRTYQAPGNDTSASWDVGVGTDRELADLIGAVVAEIPGPRCRTPGHERITLEGRQRSRLEETSIGDDATPVESESPLPAETRWLVIGRAWAVLGLGAAVSSRQLREGRSQLVAEFLESGKLVEILGAA